MAKKIGPVLAVIGSDTRGFTDGLSKAQKQLQQFSSTAAIAGVRASAAFASTFGVLGAFALKTGADFELAFANVKKTVDGSVTEFANLENSIRDTAKEFGIAATEIADLARIGGQLGIATKDLDAFTKTIAKLSIAASELDPETAARGLARLAALTKEGSGSIEKMANVIAKLGDTLPTTESRILDMSERLASFGSAVGLTSEEILGLGAGFSALVGGTERAATAVERFLGEMASAVAANGSELQAFADLASKSMEAPINSIEEFKTAFETKPLEAITAVLGGMETLGKEGLAPLLQSFDALGITGVRMLSTFAAGAKGLDTLKLAMATAVQEAQDMTKLQKELSIQLNTVSRQFDRLKVAVVDVGITLFKAFKQQIDFVLAAGFKLVDMLAMAANFMAGLGPVTKFAIVGFIGLLGAAAGLLVVLGTIGGLVTGLSALMTTMGAVLFGTGTASVAAAGGVATYGVATGAAATSTGLLATAVGFLQTAFAGILSVLGAIAAPLAAVGVGILAGTAAMTSASRAAAEMEGGFRDGAEAAIANVGLLQKAWTGTGEVIVTSFRAVSAAVVSIVSGMASDIFEFAANIGNGIAGFIVDGVSKVAEKLDKSFGTSILDDFAAKFEEIFPRINAALGSFAPEGLTLALDQAGDNATDIAEQLLRKLGDFPPIIQEVTGAQKFMADQLGVTITAMDNAQTAAVKLSNAARENREAFAASAEGIKEVQEQQKKLVETTSQTIAGLLAEGDATARVSEAAKFLGLSVDDLRSKFGAATEEAVKQALQLKVNKEASDALKKANDDLVESFGKLTVTSVAEEFALYQAALEDSKLAGEDFTKEGLEQVITKLLEFSEITGQEIEPAGKALVKSFVAQKLAAFDAEKELKKLFETMAKGKGILTDLSKLSLDELVGDVPDFGVPEGAGGVPGGVQEGIPGGLEDVKLQFLRDQFKEVGKEVTATGKTLRTLDSAFNVLGISADSALGQIVGGLTAASNAGAQAKKGILGIKLAMAEAAAGDKGFFEAGGLDAGLALGGALVNGATSIIAATAGGGIKGAIGGALAGAQVGKDIGEAIGIPGGAAIGAALGAGIGAAIGLFRGKPEFKKIMEEVGRDWGVDISEELAKGIEETADRLDIGRFEARLLSLGDIIGEAGGVGAFGMEQATKAVGDLFNAVEMGVVPAEEGISEIGEVFGQMANEIFEAGKLADSGMLAIIERSRQLGIEVPEITQFITEQLAQAAAGISKIIGTLSETEGGEEIFGGIQVASVEDAQAQATIFAAGFFATLKEQGLLAAVDAFEPAFGEMKKKFEEFGGEVDFGGVQKFFDIAQDPQFRPLLEGIGGLTEAMTGLGNAGFLTRDTFAAFQQQGAAAFTQLQEAGLGVNESLQQMAPFLQEAINASQQFGFALDEDTQKMIAQAEAAGIAFKTDPMLQVVDVLKLIAGELGVLPEKLAGVGTAAQESANTTATAYEESSVRSGEAFDGMAVRGEQAYDRLANAGTQSAQETAAASKSAADDTVAATEAATESAKMSWMETGVAVGTNFDMMKDKALEDYAIIVENTGLASEAVAGLGQQAFDSVAGFDAMARAAKSAADAARSANAAAGGGGGGGGADRAGQFGLTTTVNEPTTFLAGEAGEETVTIDPGGNPGAGGGPSTLVLQIDGKTIGKVLGDLSRTGDVRIHPSAVEDFG